MTTLQAKIPRRVAGVKIPRRVRQSPISGFIGSTGGQILIAGALLMAARSFAVSRLDPDSRPGRIANHPLDAAMELLSGTAAVLTASGRAGEYPLAHAIREGLRAFRDALNAPLDGGAPADATARPSTYAAADSAVADGPGIRH